MIVWCALRLPIGRYVQSNSHYQAARYVLSLVLGVYFVYFFATVGVRAYFGLGFEEDPDALRTVVARRVARCVLLAQVFGRTTWTINMFPPLRDC